jgi:hypothetical protein
MRQRLEQSMVDFEENGRIVEAFAEPRLGLVRGLEGAATPAQAKTVVDE